MNYKWDSRRYCETWPREWLHGDVVMRGYNGYDFRDDYRYERVHVPGDEIYYD
jgi:hypothetical protein